MPKSYAVPTDPIKIFLAICSPFVVYHIYDSVRNKNAESQKYLETECEVRFEPDAIYIPKTYLSLIFQETFPYVKNLDGAKINLHQLGNLLATVPEVEPKMFEDELKDNYEQRLQEKISELNQNFNSSFTVPVSRGDFVAIASDLFDGMYPLLAEKDIKQLGEELREKGLGIDQELLSNVNAYYDLKTGKQPVDEWYKRTLSVFLDPRILIDRMLDATFREMPPVIFTPEELGEYLKSLETKVDYTNIADGIHENQSLILDIAGIAGSMFKQYTARSKHYSMKMGSAVNALVKYLEKLKVEKKDIDEARAYAEDVMKVFSVRSPREAGRVAKFAEEKFGPGDFCELGRKMVARLVDPMVDKILDMRKKVDEMEDTLNKKPIYSPGSGTFEMRSVLEWHEKAVLRFFKHYFERDITNSDAFLTGKKFKGFQTLKNLERFRMYADLLSVKNSKVPTPIREQAIKYMAKFIESEKGDLWKNIVDIMIITDVLQRSEGYAMPQALQSEFIDAMRQNNLSLFYDAITTKPRFRAYYTYLKNNRILN